MSDQKEALALVIAKAMPGWNEDTSEPDRPGWSEAMRQSAELTWRRINESCIEQGRELAEAVLAAGYSLSTSALVSVAIDEMEVAALRAKVGCNSPE